MKALPIAAAALPLFFVACMGGPPGVDKRLVERPSQVVAWENELEKSPHDIRLYQRLIDSDFQNRDLANAKRTALQCVDSNPRSWEAWMLAAQVHRTVFELAATEEALKNATKFAPADEPSAAMALSAFYTEVGDPAAAAKLARVAFDIKANLATSSALVKAFLAQRMMSDPLELKDYGDDEFEYLLTQSGLDQIGEIYGFIDIAKVAALKDARQVMRLVNLEPGPEIEAVLRRFLLESEDKDIRFACYFGLWEMAIRREGSKTIPGISAEATQLAEKLDQIDDRHPMWLMRHCQYALATGAHDELGKIEGNMQAIGLPLPTQIETRARLFQLWAIEDAARLGLSRWALRLMQDINPRDDEVDAFLLQRAQLLSETGQRERALEMLKSRMTRTMGTAPDAIRYQIFLLRSAMGEAKAVEAELQEMAKKNAPFKVSLPALAWLRAMIDYHKARTK